MEVSTANFSGLDASTKRGALAIFCRAPRCGQVKTRIAQTRGDEFALGLYRAMLADTFDLARRLAPEIETFACFTPGDGFEGENSLAEFWDGPKLAQCEGDLGAKILDCFAQLRAQGYPKIAVIGSDAPDIRPDWLQNAFGQIETHNGVLGQTADGGFWLLGASQPLPPDAFEGVIWSGPTVAGRLLANLEQSPQPWRMAAVPSWFDCDDADHLKELRGRLSGHDAKWAPETSAFLLGKL